MGFKITDYDAKTVFNDTDLYDCSTDATTSEKVTYAQLKTDLDSSLSFLTSVPSGKFGISDANGVYTFYADINAAFGAASVGDTVVQFADVDETGAVEAILKDGVDWNLNGYTYEMSNAGTLNAVTDNNVDLECTLFNGTIIRSGGTASEANSLAVHIDDPLSIVKMNGMNVHSTFGCAMRNEGQVIGGNYSNELYFAAIRSLGILKNIDSRGYGGVRISGGGAKAYYINSSSTNATAIDLINGEIHHSNGFSQAGFGIDGGTTTKVYHCYGESTANNGINMGSSVASELHHSVGRSSGGKGIDSDCDTYDCIGISTSTYGFWKGNTSRNVNNIAISSADIAMWLNAGAATTGCKAYCTLNTSAGHALRTVTTDIQIADFYGETVHADANAIWTSLAINAKLVDIRGSGMTTLINAGITNTNTDTKDTYGNIIVG